MARGTPERGYFVHVMLALLAARSGLVVPMPTAPSDSTLAGGSCAPVVLLESSYTPAAIAQTPPAVLLIEPEADLPELPAIKTASEAEAALTGRYVGQRRARISRACDTLQTATVRSHVDNDSSTALGGSDVRHRRQAPAISCPGDRSARCSRMFPDPRDVCPAFSGVRLRI